MNNTGGDPAPTTPAPMVVTAGEVAQRAESLCRLIGRWAPLSGVRFAAAARPGALDPVRARLSYLVSHADPAASVRLLGQVHAEMFRRDPAPVFAPADDVPQLVMVIDECAQMLTAPAAANLAEALARMGAARGVVLVLSAPTPADIPAELLAAFPAGSLVNVNDQPPGESDPATTAAAAAEYAGPVRGITLGRIE